MKKVNKITRGVVEPSHEPMEVDSNETNSYESDSNENEINGLINLNFLYYRT